MAEHVFSEFKHKLSQRKRDKQQTRAESKAVSSGIPPVVNEVKPS